ncbi:MAG: hypothetical protein WC570_03920 [Patescibacteria group bacterium]
MLTSEKFPQPIKDFYSTESTSKPVLNDRLAIALNNKLEKSAKQIGDIIDSGLDTSQKRKVIKSKITQAIELINANTGGAYLNMMYNQCKKMQKQELPAGGGREIGLMCKLAQYQNYMYIKHLENNKSL